MPRKVTCSVNMKILISTLKEEFASVKGLERKYLKKIGEMPNGSFIVRTVGKKKYGYFTFRDGEKIKQKYLGSLDNEAIENYRAQIKRRQALKEKLKSVREQMKVLGRALRGKTK